MEEEDIICKLNMDKCIRNSMKLTKDHMRINSNLLAKNLLIQRIKEKIKKELWMFWGALKLHLKGQAQVLPNKKENRCKIIRITWNLHFKTVKIQRPTNNKDVSIHILCRNIVFSLLIFTMGLFFKESDPIIGKKAIESGDINN